ncbi:Uncharacterized protein RDABS01_026672 [Bienertia sinuspersici]
MASNFPDSFDFPQFPPPSNNPFNPHPHPHPLPPPPSPDPHHHSATIIVIIFSFGCLLVVGALLLCMWWLMKRHLSKEKKLIHERKDMDVDEHMQVQEMIVPGCCGHKKVKVFVKDDIRKHADFHKDEVDMVSKGVRGNPKDACSSQQLSISEQQV